MELRDHRAVLNVMGQYFDGLYRADPASLRSIFHDDLSYVNGTKDAFVAKGREAYLKDVDDRIPPDEAGDQRNPHVLQIQQVSDRIVFVRASLSMMGRDYDDALTLIDTADGWKIVAKIFSHTPIGDLQCLT